MDHPVIKTDRTLVEGYIPKFGKPTAIHMTPIRSSHLAKWWVDISMEKTGFRSVDLRALAGELNEIADVLDEMNSKVPET